MDQTREHSIEVNNRKSIKITGVRHVDSYDDKEVVLKTSMGDLIIKGTELNISNLNLEDGNLQVIGLVESFLYAEEAGTKRKNFIKRILK